VATQVLADYGSYTYVSDDGNSYNVKMMVPLATAGGFSASVGPAFPPDIPKGYRMRYILGKTSTGKLGKLHIASATGSQFVTPTGAWTGNNAVSYTCTGGAIGEKRHSTL
jgi:hypothetical protein